MPVRPAQGATCSPAAPVSAIRPRGVGRFGCEAFQRRLIVIQPDARARFPERLLRLIQSCK
jgi:hypothetical protein